MIRTRLTRRQNNGPCWDRRVSARAVFAGRVRGFDPPQEVAEPPEKVLQNPFGGSTLTPLGTPPIPFSC